MVCVLSKISLSREVYRVVLNVCGGISLGNLVVLPWMMWDIVLVNTNSFMHDFDLCIALLTLTTQHTMCMSVHTCIHVQLLTLLLSIAAVFCLFLSTGERKTFTSFTTSWQDSAVTSNCPSTS